MIFPAPLQPGDTVALLSPATTVNPDYVSGAAEALRAEGLNPLLMPYVNGPAAGTFASAQASRLDDLTRAFADTNIKAILCARGGYGCAHLLPEFAEAVRRAPKPKWLIGFSDISALHAVLQSQNIASLHAGMAKFLTETPTTSPLAKSWWRCLRMNHGDAITYTAPALPGSRTGTATGVIRGGNFAVLQGLIATPWDLLTGNATRGAILFIEDVAEPIYKVERMLLQLLYAGTFDNIAGLIVGQFTEYRPDNNFETMEDMLRRFLATRLPEARFPVALGFPIGHTDSNHPIIEGATATLEVAYDHATLTMTLI